MKRFFSLQGLLCALSLLLLPVACSSDEEPTPQPEPSPDPVTLKLSIAGIEQQVVLTEGELKATLQLTADEAADERIRVVVSLDDSYAEAQAPSYGEQVLPLPAEALRLPEVLELAPGVVQSGVELYLDGLLLEADRTYLLALRGEVVAGEAEMADGDEPLTLLVKRVEAPRTMHQVVFFEVNNCNPLNALEYRLKDGSPFFDAVVLFAANINYNANEQRVYLHCNPNVQALLDSSEELLQPLRKAGIKVYLGLLGNHDEAGLAQLSASEAQRWAAEVAAVCARYGLDGVNLDDEYSNSPDLSNPLFTLPSAAAGARLAYELKGAMREQCGWPTEVSIFEYGNLKSLPQLLLNGQVHPQSEFIDLLIPNYGSVSMPYGDLTYAQCAGASLELNYGDTLSQSYARGILEQGFGWCMWFGFDPSGSGAVRSNLTHSFKQFTTAAEIFYGQALREPRLLYHKLGEGSFDSTPHPIE